MALPEGLVTYTRGLARVPGWLWVVLAITGFLVALVFAARQSVAWIRADERRAVLASVDSLRPIVWPIEYARLTRERDSLRAEAERRDTVLVTRVRTVRELLTDTLRHTDTLIVRACGELADDCDAFRVSATTSLVKADSVHAADSTANARLLLSVAAQTRTIGDLTTRLDRRPSWGTVHVRTGTGFGLGMAVGYGACAIRK